MLKGCAVEPVGHGKAFQSHLQLIPVIAEYAPNQLAATALEGLGGDMKKLGRYRGFFGGQTAPMLDLKIEHERVDLRVLSRFLSCALDNRPANILVIDRDSSKPVIGIRHSKTVEEMLGILKVLTPIRIVFPWQPFPREEHGQEAVAFLDQGSHMPVKVIFPPARAGAALVEYTFVFVDKEDKALLRVPGKMMVQVLGQHPG